MDYYISQRVTLSYSVFIYPILKSFAVGKPNYVCGSCKADFSRKSNAVRHSLNVHKGQAEIIRVGDHKLREMGLRIKVDKNSTGWPFHDTRKEALYDILEKLVPPFEEMEQSLSSDYSMENKRVTCGQAIIHAVSSADPIRYMTKYTDSVRKGRSVRKMIKYVAFTLNVSESVAEETLVNAIKRSFTV